MKKIIVAGAGHGGLTAAYNLAKSGFDVTVLEKCKRSELGYPWNDSMAVKVFEDSGLVCPKENLSEYEIMCFYNPKMTVKLSPKREKVTSIVTIDRIFLINYLIDNCIDAGVKFRFGTEIKVAVCDEFGVIGVETDNGKIFCDLVIDACGIDSPVRTSLNPKFGIQNEIGTEDKFFVYRAHYERIAEGKTEPRFNVAFYHGNRAGMDWCVLHDDCIDILVGGFGSLTGDDVENSVTDFMEKFPYFSNKIISGGTYHIIPVRRMLPLIVCNGYAAVGDSATMVEPLNGSGLSFSMRAGKMLADVVIETKDFSKKSLWKYNYRAFNEIGKQYLVDDVVSGLIDKFSPDEIDYLLETKILSDKEVLDKSNVKYTPLELGEKLVLLSKRPKLCTKLVKTLKNMAKVPAVARSIPQEYNKAEIDGWIKKYNRLR